jgi:large subunit ribosomal protein L10
VERAEKNEIVASIQEKLGRSQVALLANPIGLTVAEVTNLRRQIRAVGGELKVAKNTLMRLAVRETSYEAMTPLLEGSNALVFGYSDPVGVAKILVKYAEENKKLTIRGGVLAGKALPAEAVVDLAKLPSREVLLAQLLGLLQAPASQLLRTINEPGARMARLIDRLRAAKAEAAPAE